jgi:uncharacterized protein
MPDTPPSDSSLVTDRPFHILAKPIGPICNLDCQYCFYLEKEALYPGRKTTKDWAMSPEVVEAFVRQYIESQPGPVANFAWQGGEPTLLGVEFFRRVVGFQAKHAGGRTIENAIQTNGVLLDDEWCEFLAANRFLVGLSIDGPAAIHDRYRVDKGGKPTFRAVMRGLDALKRHQVEFNTLTVVHRHNASAPLEVYRFLKSIGSQYLQFIPIVERLPRGEMVDGMRLVSPDSAAAARVSPWSVEPAQWGAFLCTMFDEWVRHDVGQVYVQLFDVALESWVGMPQSVCIFRETCGAAVAIEHTGDLYSCDHYVYPQHRLGNILEQPLASLLQSPQQVRFGDAKRDALPRDCRECDVRFACNGECPKHRFARTPGGETGLNYLCAGYQRFFRHIDPLMRVMAEELANRRPPANVMGYVKERDHLG